jgi:hypothetical protein
MIAKTGYAGFKEEDMMLPTEIQNEQKKFKKWEQIAFDDEPRPRVPRVPVIQYENSKEIQKIFLQMLKTGKLLHLSPI